MKISQKQAFFNVSKFSDFIAFLELRDISRQFITPAETAILHTFRFIQRAESVVLSIWLTFRYSGYIIEKRKDDCLPGGVAS
jgi:hypothetical protein